MPAFLRHACLLALVCTPLACQQEARDTLFTESAVPDVVGVIAQIEFSSEDAEVPELSEVLLRAGEAVQGIEGSEEKRELLLAIAVVQAKAGNRIASTEAFRAAFQLADALDDPDDKAYALSDIAQQQAEAGDFKSALATATVLQTLKLQGLHSEPEATYALIAIRQAEQGRFRVAFQTLELIHDAHWESEILAQIGACQWSRGDRDGGKETLQRAAAAAGQIESLYLQASALTSVAEAHATNGDLDSAHKLIDEALQIAKSEPLTYRQPALESIAHAQAACGDLDGVFRTVASLRQVGSARNLQSAIWAAKSGDFTTAINSLTASRLGLWEHMIQRHVADAYSTSGDFESAAKIARTISDRRWRCFALREIVSDQIAAGRLAEAAETCAAIDDELDRGRTLSKLAAARMDAGDVELALTLFDQSRDAVMRAVAEDSYSGFIMREIAASEAESGRVHASFVWAARQQSALARANALIGVAEGLQKRLQDVRETTNIE